MTMIDIPKHAGCIGFILLVLSMGCGRRPVDSHDQKALERLKEFHPSYKLDKKGRVIDLKLEADVSGQALDAVGQLKEIRRLTLQGAAVNDDNISKLQGLKWLEDLTIRENALTDEGLAHLEKMSRLRSLSLRPNGKLSQKGADSLEKLLRNVTVYWRW